jgi:hypothetical protein
MVPLSNNGVVFELSDDQPACFADNAVGSVHQSRHILHEVIDARRNMPFSAQKLVI